MVEDNKLSSTKEVDIYRDTYIRYLGYANEVGEAFRAWIGHKGVVLTYGVATCYVLADTLDKSKRVFKEYENRDGQIKKTAIAATDTLVWQMLASVAIPGFTINRLCKGTDYCFSKYFKGLKSNPRKLAVTSIGLLAIPLIIKPIDHSVDFLMDKTFRKVT